MNVVTRTLIRSAGIRTVVRSPLCHASALPSRFARTYSAPSSPIPTLNGIESLVESMKASKDVESIHSSFSTLATAIEHSDGHGLSFLTPSPDDQKRLLYILQLLANSGQPEDINRIEEILSNLYPLLGITPSKTVYTSILQSLVAAHHEPQAREFLLNTYQSLTHPNPDIEQFHIVLEGCKQSSLFADLIADIQRLNLNPTSQTFRIIFHTRKNIVVLEDEAPSVDELSNLIQQCVQHGMTYDPVVTDALYDTYAALNRIPDSLAIFEIYHSAFRTSKNETQDVDSDLINELPSEKPYFGFATHPQVDDPSTAHEVLPDRVVNADIMLKKLCSPGRFGYDVALEKCIASGLIGDALGIYEQALQANIIPSNSLLTPFLKAVVESPISDQHLDKTIAMCRRLADAVKTLPITRENTPRSKNPELTVYNSLIRVLSASSDISRYSPIINDLLDEMQKRGLPMDTQLTGVTKIILQMRRTGSFEDSMDTYRQYRPLLGEYGYVRVLKEYCRISFAGDLQVPLITEFFSIVNDMRLARVPIKPIIYTIFLHSIGMSATRLWREGDPGGVFERLVSSTRRVHDFLTLDASISPDPVLWNQLMNTYQRLGCFAEACRLWDMMYLTGRYDQISVNIMLDACGFHPDLRKARSIMAKLDKSGFKMDLRNWNTWIECLCRCERFDEAADVILLEMGKHGVKADMQSVSVLFKFMIKRANTVQMADIRRRVEVQLPHLWKRLPKEMQNP